MKKLLLFTAAAIATLSSSAQYRFTHTPAANQTLEISSFSTKIPGTAAKTTAVGDTVFISHISTTAGTDTASLYSFQGDTGCVIGINAFGDKGFAERYDVTPATATYKVIGVRALFGGKIVPTSTKDVTFTVWSQAGKSPSFRPTLFNNGLPGSVLTSGVRPITQLGIGVGPTDNDTTKNHMFATPTAYLTDSFFVGYTINYSWTALAGDTIGLYTNLDNERSEPGYFPISTSDTTINNVSVTQRSSGTWADNGSGLYGLFANLAIFPIVIIGPGTTTDVQGGITRRDFTFYGNFPNPSTNSTNVKIALASSADVTINVTDISGREVASITKNNLSAGEHLIEINTSQLPAGEYIYLVHTSAGDGIASQLIVTR